MNLVNVLSPEAAQKRLEESRLEVDRLMAEKYLIEKSIDSRTDEIDLFIKTSCKEHMDRLYSALSHIDDEELSVFKQRYDRIVGQIRQVEIFQNERATLEAKMERIQESINEAIKQYQDAESDVKNAI